MRANTEKPRAVRMVELVHEMNLYAGEQFTIDDLVHLFKSTPKRIEKMCNKAVDNFQLRTGRNTAGHRVYWAMTATERDRSHRFGIPDGELSGYTAYLHSHWRVAEGAPWGR